MALKYCVDHGLIQMQTVKIGVIGIGTRIHIGLKGGVRIVRRFIY